MQKKKDAHSREDIVALATHMLISEFTRNDQCIKKN